ncbi:TOR complex subunit lst8 [Didymella pomorum]|uniref:TOR complex subunit lst8 n=1 Tax=Didymella pomorum TaxID=749634 RepID=A0A9W8Z719_9PLEO|nr:TOR complex subunit lst8 [Didymella pomorum]
MSVILCTAGYDHTIRFWEALSGICSRTIPHPDSQVNRLCISPDKRYLAAAGHHTVKLYDIKSTNPNAILTFDGHTSNVTGVAFHCESKWLVTSSEDGTVKIWDTRSGNVQRNYTHGVPVNDVVIHPNQGELISCDRGGNVRIWDLGENKCSHQLIPEDDVSVASVTVASDGSMVCAGNNAGNVYVWKMVMRGDLTSIIPVCKFLAHHTYITRVLLSPDVRHLATCSADHTSRIWSVDLSSPHNVQPGDALPSAAERDPAAFPLETTLHGHQRWVWDCAFSADSAYLVTACSDHYARLWELGSQSIIRQYNGHHRGAVFKELAAEADIDPHALQSAENVGDDDALEEYVEEIVVDADGYTYIPSSEMLTRGGNLVLTENGSVDSSADVYGPAAWGAHENLIWPEYVIPGAVQRRQDIRWRNTGWPE